MSKTTILRCWRDSLVKATLPLGMLAATSACSHPTASDDPASTVYAVALTVATPSALPECMGTTAVKMGIPGAIRRGRKLTDRGLSDNDASGMPT